MFRITIGLILVVCTTFGSALGQKKETIQFNFLPYDDFLKKSKETGKPVMIYFTGTGCSLCIKMEKQVFPQEEIYSFYNKSFINIEIFDDFKKPDSAIKRLQRKYGIVSQPTFIFIDSTGEVIHKSGYKEKNDFLLVGQQAIGSDNYRGWISLFDKGEVEINTLKKFLAVEQKPILYAELDYRCKAQDMLDKYFSSLQISEYSNSDNWEIINKYVGNPYSEIFKFLLENKSKFIDDHGESEVNKKIYSVFQDAWSGDIQSASYIKAEKMIMESNEPMAKLLVINRQMGDEARNNKRIENINWINFLNKYNSIVLQYYYLVNPFLIYQISEQVTTKNPSNLEAIKLINTWLKSILEISANEDEDFFSEYAKTYFILGDKKSAINAQKRAVELAEKRKVEKKYLDEYKSLLETYMK
jgi:thioredoxin-related protein